jgi:hypothetical protein
VQAALNGIRSQAMLRLQEQAQRLKGAWNSRGVTQYLNQNSAKPAKVFTPWELTKVSTLHDAGNTPDVDRTDPGAAAQQHNLAMRGLIGAVRHGAGYLGAHVGHGAAGDFIGEVVGTKGANMLERRFSPGIRTRDLSATTPELQQMLSDPRAAKWFGNKRTAGFLQTMRRINSRAQLLRAAQAMHDAGQQEKNSHLTETAQAVRAAITGSGQ